VTDDSLILAMSRGDPAAWGAYEARFRPILEAYARRSKIPVWEWPTCVTEVLEDEAFRFSRGTVPPPINLAAYLVTAVHHRYLRLKRTNACRERYYDAAGEDRSGEWVVPSLCSEDLLRTSGGPDVSPGFASGALGRLVAELREGLTPEEESILVWVSERVPHAQIATWLGTSYDACTKRIWRLCRRLRTESKARSATYSGSERLEIERFMRRAADHGGAAASADSRARQSKVPIEAESHGRGTGRGARMASGAG
jgi:DNA-directed RNA polymerase specialized sigma24 family protein